MKNVRISTLLLLAAAALVLVIGASNAMANCGGEGCCGGKMADQPRGGDKAAEGKGKCGRAGSRLNLSDEDGAKVRAILGEAQEAMKAWHAENAEAFKALGAEFAAAKEAGDEAKLKELAARKQELMAGAKALHEEYKVQLAEVLTEEQMATLKRALMRRCGGQRMMGGRGPRGQRGSGPKGDRDGKGQRGGHRMMGGKLDLTDEQKAEAKAIMAAAMEQAKGAETPEAKKAIFTAAHEQVFNDVLTAEQQEKAKAMREGRGQRGGCGGPGACGGKDHDAGKGGCGGKGAGHRGDQAGPVGLGHMRMMAEKLGMSDEQKAQAKAILAAAMEQAKGAETREAKAAAMKAAQTQIFNEVLTAEQQEEAKAMHQAFEGRCGQQGQGGRGGPRACGGKDHDAGKCGCGGKGKDAPAPAPAPVVAGDVLAIEPTDE